MKRRGSIALLLLLAACRKAPAPAVPPLRPIMERSAAASLVDADGVSHAGTTVAPGGAFEWKLPPRRGGRLRFAWSSSERRGPARLVVERLVGADRAGQTILSRERAIPEPPAPAELAYEDIELVALPSATAVRFRLEPAGPLFLSDLRLVTPSAAARALLVVVLDTTRHDAVGFGGCRDASTPNLDAIFRDGWKPARVYAPASWTIPSVAALLTGRVPAAHEDADGSPMGIVPTIPTMADDFRRAGWSTAAFVANPTLRAENGFAAGFTAFFTTPYAGASITMPGRETARRAPRWIAAHEGEPFFVWIHLMDPHDPYTPFDRPRGQTPFDPDYRGPIVGDEVNRLQLGDPPVPTAADVRHLEALYHDEVRLADAALGELWDRTPEDERNRWTVVFTSDHGEEFGEHGGWKHGPSLFDEVLRVPLALRAGGERKLPEVPAETLVSLLDLLPTLERFEGLPPAARTLDGVDLFDPASRRRDVLPAVTMLTGGAPRAAVVHRASKLVFFDRLGTRGIPDAAKDPNGFRLAKRLPSILPGLGRFDLLADPNERKLLPIDQAVFAADWRAIERAMAGTRKGLELRVVSSGGPAAVGFNVGGFSAAAAVEPFALEENDRFSWDRSGSGRSLAARLDVSDGVDGFLFSEAPKGSLRIKLEDGCLQLRLEGARPVALASGQPQDVPLAAISDAIPSFETAGECPGLFLWRASGKTPARSPQEQEEAVKKLRSLGYLH